MPALLINGAESVKELGRLNSKQITVIAVAALAVGVAAVCCFLHFRKRLSSFKGDMTANQDAVRSQLVSHAAVFSGLYEAIYKIGIGESRFRQGVVGDFVVRMKGISDAEELCERLDFLSAYMGWDSDTGAKKMKELTEFFLANGIIRDSAAEITVDANTYARYDVADGERLYDGTAATVIAPYWQIGDKILEKGIILERGGKL